MSELKDYIANDTGWIAGKRVTKGDKLKLTAAAAKYENVTLAGAEPAPKANDTKPAPTKGTNKAGGK